MKRITIFLLVVVLTLLSAGSALAWGGNSSARIRVVNASPDSPQVYVKANNNIILGHVFYGDISVYASLPPGTYNIKIITANQAQTVLVDTNMVLEQDTSYTVVASGMQNSITPIKITDNSTPPEYGTANLQFVQTASDVFFVDVAIVDGDVLFKNVPLNQPTNYALVDAGAYDLEVRRAGTQDVLLEIPWVPTYSGTASTVFMMGLQNVEVGLDASFSTDDQFRMSHPSPCCHYSRPQYYPQIRHISPGPNYFFFRGNTPGWPNWGW